MHVCFHLLQYFSLHDFNDIQHLAFSMVEVFSSSLSSVSIAIYLRRFCESCKSGVYICMYNFPNTLVYIELQHHLLRGQGFDFCLSLVLPFSPPPFVERTASIRGFILLQGHNRLAIWSEIANN